MTVHTCGGAVQPDGAPPPVAQRDLNPHQAAVVAMWLYGKRYAEQSLGSMGFWCSLADSDRDLCRRMLREIKEARPE